MKLSNSLKRPTKFIGANRSLIHLSNSDFPFIVFNLESVYIYLDGNPLPQESEKPYLLKKDTSLGPERYSVSSLIKFLNFSITFDDIIIFDKLTIIQAQRY